ncbi:hypothetical protein MKW94_011837 [Papaver nudicaule]|uniref:CASP-like protein n=1 Tax=Papaver nudicaule TaxID=74823 RepID=A0AA41VGQ0_PAPNU|nr:hypothetical protein [Papaver nudicaule]
MKNLIGGPGTVSGLMLRLGQFLFSSASIGVMVSASGFSSYTAYCYLIASMGLQVLWSLGLACLDIYALKLKRDLQNPVVLSLFAVGDWVITLFPLTLFTYICICRSVVSLISSSNSCTNISMKTTFILMRLAESFH